jgi:hypothetical protein
MGLSVVIAILLAVIVPPEAPGRARAYPAADQAFADV